MNRPPREGESGLPSDGDCPTDALQNLAVVNRTRALHTDRMAVRWSFVVAFLFALCSASSAQTVGNGSVSGQVHDHTGDVLPGVTVVLAGPGLKRRVVTDSTGTYFVEGPAGVYSLTASLPGFDSFEVRGITVEAGGHVDLPITLQLGCITPDLYVDIGLAAALKEADAVLLLRVVSSAPPVYRRLGNFCGIAYEYTATVIERIKDIDPAAPMTVTFVTFEDRQFEVGAEYLAFFERVPRGRRFHVYSPGYTARIVGSEVPCGATSLPCGIVADVVENLRNLTGR